MARRFLTAMFAAAALSGSVAAGAPGWSDQPFLAEAPIEAEKATGYGSSQLLLFQSFFPSTAPAITRVDADGGVDRSFGHEGTVARYANDIAVDGKGRILLAGDGRGRSPNRVRALLARLLPDGSTDHSFGAGGFARIDGSQFAEATAVAVEADGDILLGGVAMASNHGREGCMQVIRLRPDGNPDPSFGEDGVADLFCGAYEEVVLDLKPIPSGGVIVAVGNEVELGVTMLNSDGSSDRGFGKRGWYQLPFESGAYGGIRGLLPVPEVAVMPRGKVLLAASGELSGGAETVVGVRLLLDGRLDRSYGKGGWAVLRKTPGSSYPVHLTLLAGGVLAVATDFSRGEDAQFGAVAFGPDGRPTHGFGRNGVCRAQLPEDHEAIGIADLGGRPLVVGTSKLTEVWLLQCRSGTGPG